MRQSMAFNLEFKITYDELSPSLQDMFKSLQGQITDNRNEITNINMDITDITNEINEINKEITTINNHLTQIDNSITNINKNIQNIENNIDQIEQNITNIEGDITNLGDQITEINNNITIINDKLEEVDPDTISNLDFLNLAPKIGFYQDDTIEVISKYNMNYDILFYPSMTRNNLGEEVIYCGGNDGSPNNYPIKMYIGKRSSDSDELTFYNTPLDIPYLEGKIGEDESLSYSRYADNDWVFVTNGNTSNYKAYIIFTNGYSDSKEWTDGIDVSNIIKDANCDRDASNFILIRYFKEYNTVSLVFYKYTTNKNANGPCIRTYDATTLSLKLEVELEGVFKFLNISDPRSSYAQNERITNCLDPKARSITLSAWTSIFACIWFDKQEFMSLELNAMRYYYYYDADNDGIYEQDTYWGGPHLRLAYKIPLSVAKGTSSSGVYCYNNNKPYLNLTYYNGFANQGKILQNIVYYKWTSMDSNNGYVYLLTSEDTNKTKKFFRIKISECFNHPEEPFYNGIPDSVYTPPNPYRSANTSDSSQWGKFIKQHFCYPNDIHVFYGLSKLGDNTFYVEEFQKIKGFENKNYFEPKPGKYGLMYNCPYISGKFTSCKMTDGSSKLYSCTLTSTGIDVRTITVDKETRYPNYQIVGSLYKSFKVQLSEVAKLLGMNNNYNEYEYYNPIGDYILIFMQNTDSTKLNSMSRKMGICLLKNDGTLIPLIYGDKTSTSVYDCYSNRYSTDAYNNLPNKQASLGVGVGCVMDKYTIYYKVSYQYTSDNYGDGGDCLKLNQNLDGIERLKFVIFKNSRAYSYNVSLFQSIYSGPKWGLTFQMNGWSNNPGWPIYFQKPSISGEGKTYTDDQWFSNILTNSNIYYIYCQSAQGLICYIPSTNIFLGGYYTAITNSIIVNLTANADNYIYLERGDDRDTINAYATTEQLYYEGQRLFSKICVAKITTDEANITNVEYYRINIGYNDYIWNGGGG